MSTAIVWFRQDLRLDDNPALFDACQAHDSLILLYILDPKHPVGGAQRWWLHHSLKALQGALKKQHLTLHLQQGDPLTLLSALIKQHAVTHLYWNRCYEPKTIARDTHICKVLTTENIIVQRHPGNLLFEPWTIQNQSGKPFKVFTPFWKACLKKTVKQPEWTIQHYPQNHAIPTDTLDAWHLLPRHPNWADGFDDVWEPGEHGAHERLKVFIEDSLDEYDKQRDFPALSATSYLSPHLHFGEISVFRVWHTVLEAERKRGTITAIQRFFSELGWREFSYHLLYHMPSLPHENVRKTFDHFPWVKNEAALHAWQKGLTGYPIIDAGMRELWTTGYMHNRVRMLVASFLTKDLFIDWRQGADWFLDTLVDADLANNSASWQWVAGCGADAAPYFRIFNPIRQSLQFDANGDYIRQWIPALRAVPTRFIHAPWTGTPEETGIILGKDYPKPIIDQSQTRAKLRQAGVLK